MRFFKATLGALLALVLGLVLLFGIARWLDGPIGFIPGGPLVSGERINAPVSDWQFVAPIDEVEMQLLGEDTSRTTWIVADQGRAYIPASLSFPPGKTWHRRADQKGEALIRIDEKVYPVELIREQDEAIRDRLKTAARTKYEVDAVSGDGVWFFRLDPPSS